MQRTYSRNSARALLIFTRNPEPGKCKTRLAATVGDPAALAIYRFLLRHTATVAKNLPEVDKFTYFTEKKGDGSTWDPALFHHKLQQGVDLGAKMQHAVSESFQKGYSHVVLIGSDLHDIRTSDLKEAFRQLDHHEVVLGPAADGGYYLIGMKRAFPRLFEKKEWGTGSVLEETLKDLEGTDVFLLPVRNDVDCYEDIKGNPIFETIIKQTNNE